MSRNQWIIINSLYAPHPVNRGSAVRIIEMVTYLRQYYSVGIYVHVKYSKSAELAKYFDAVWESDSLKREYTVIEKIQDAFYRVFSFFYKRNPLVVCFKPYSCGMLNHLCRKYKPIAVISEYVFPVVPAALICRMKGILSIVDTHDIQYLRKRSESMSSNVDLRDNMCEELNLLALNDVIIAIQDREREELVRSLPKSHVLTAMHPCIAGSDYVPSPEKNTVLFTGSNAKHNIDSMLQFISVVWPKVLSLKNDAQLHICGQICENIQKEVKNSASLNIVLHGFCESLAPYYSKASVVVNPIVYGSGLKIKTVEAVVYNKCLISTSIGVEGFEAFGDGLFSVCDIEDMAGEIVRLLTDEKARHEIENNVSLLAKRFMPENCYHELIDILGIESARKINENSGL